jgi:hypothetical protein
MKRTILGSLLFIQFSTCSYRNDLGDTPNTLFKQKEKSNECGDFSPPSKFSLKFFLSL